MRDSLDSKRIFLLVIPDKDRRSEIAEKIHAHISRAVIYEAFDGAEALNKIDSVVPHVLITEKNLARTSGARLVDSVLHRKSADKIAVIFISEIPEDEFCIEEVALGQLQFLPDASDSLSMQRCLARALNFLSFLGKDLEFNLYFLAPGDVLLKQSDKAEFVYIVRQGKLNAIAHLAGKETLLGCVSEGEFVGEMAYINGEPRVATVVAQTECELVAIPIDHMDQLLFQKPAWSKALVRTLAERIKKVNSRVGSH